jgi:hypothetical protein
MSSLDVSGCIGIAFENGDIVNPIVSRYNVANEAPHRSQQSEEELPGCRGCSVIRVFLQAGGHLILIEGGKYEERLASTD